MEGAHLHQAQTRPLARLPAAPASSVEALVWAASAPWWSPLDTAPSCGGLVAVGTASGGCWPQHGPGAGSLTLALASCLRYPGHPCRVSAGVSTAASPVLATWERLMGLLGSRKGQIPHSELLTPGVEGRRPLIPVSANPHHPRFHRQVGRRGPEGWAASACRGHGRAHFAARVARRTGVRLPGIWLVPAAGAGPSCRPVSSPRFLSPAGPHPVPTWWPW